MTNAYDSTRGNVTDRQRRKLWLLGVYRADRDVIVRPATEHTAQWLQSVLLGEGELACRCYRCGTLLTYETLTVDRIVPGCKGGTYRRSNIRPSCSDCANKQGGELRASTRNRLPVV
jgi:5-methylcytosine-specific restriction endonuclease McrA